MNTLHAELILTEDIATNGDGLDKEVLREALKVTDTEFSEPMDGSDFLLQLAKENLV